MFVCGGHTVAATKYRRTAGAETESDWALTPDNKASHLHLQTSLTKLLEVSNGKNR